MNPNTRKPEHGISGASSPGVRDDREFSSYIPSRGCSRNNSEIEGETASRVSSGSRHPFEVSSAISQPKRSSLARVSSVGRSHHQLEVKGEVNQPKRSSLTRGSNTRRSHGPSEVESEVRQLKRGSKETRSLDHGRRRRLPEPFGRNRSHSEEELGSLVDGGYRRASPRIRGLDGSRQRDRSIEDFLPSRMAACDGLRTIAFRRSARSRRRRSARSRRGDEASEPASLDREAGSLEDVVDSAPNIQEELSEEMTIDELRCCATTMEKKKEKRKLLLDQAKTAQSGYRKWLPVTNKALLRRWGQNAASLPQHLELWTSSFKEIEGMFGASVFSYFVFVRLLFFMNLFVTLVIVAAIVVPQISIHTIFDCFRSNTSDSTLRQSCNLSHLYSSQMESVRGNLSTGAMVTDFFRGTGWMENSSLFFGFYWSEGHSSARYNLALAYILATAFYLAAIFIFMVVYTGKGLKGQMLRRKDQPSNTFERVFCGWDYSLCQVTSAREKHKSIYQELNMIYASWIRLQNRVTLTRCDKFRLYSIRVFVNILVVAQLVGAGAVIALTITRATPELQEMKLVQESDFLEFVVSYLLSIVLTLLNIILPFIFRNIILLEKYSDENRLRLTLIRTVFLRLASIAAVVITVVVQIHECKGKPCPIGNSTVAVVYCWETYLGQLLYRLVILDFVTVVLIILLLDFPQAYLVRRFPNNCLVRTLGKQEFDIPQNVIDITYAQALSWIGAFFSPLIPAMTTLKLLIFFFAKKVYTCVLRWFYSRCIFK